jgi:uncharacterized RmlC-like cupin family protein
MNYLFRAAEHQLQDAGGGLRVREAVTPFGIALRYQERMPAEPAANGVPPHWCETGHSVFVVSGRLQYRFDNQTIEAGPGDMVHIPAGPAHRHIASALGDAPACYFLTEFS